jgi:hypothetical protein
MDKYVASGLYKINQLFCRALTSLEALHRGQVSIVIVELDAELPGG